MTRHSLSRLLSLALLLMCVACTAHAQDEQSLSNISVEEYDQVMDLLFPLDELRNDRESVTILRYKPSFEAESQIVMIRREGYFQIVEYKSLDGNLFYRLDGMSSVRELSPAEMVKKVRVAKRELRVPYPEAQEWRRNLLASVYAYMRPKSLKYSPPPKVISVMMDGTSYELWDTWGRWNLHFELQGGSTHKGAPPLEASFIKWMNVVRQAVAKRK